MRESAGILLYRLRGGRVEVLLGHPGGPFWSKRDEGAWSIPKGEIDDSEDHQSAARREFQEETGRDVGSDLLSLGAVTQRGGKIVHAWAAEGDADPESLRSNTFEMEWPHGSGRMHSFPEIDRFAWFSFEEAARRLNPAQVDLVRRLEALLSG